MNDKERYIENFYAFVKIDVHLWTTEGSELLTQSLLEAQIEDQRPKIREIKESLFYIVRMSDLGP